MWPSLLQKLYPSISQLSVVRAPLSNYLSLVCSGRFFFGTSKRYVHFNSLCPVVWLRKLGSHHGSSCPTNWHHGRRTRDLVWAWHGYVLYLDPMSQVCNRRFCLLQTLTWNRCNRSAFVDRQEHQESTLLLCPLPDCDNVWCKNCQQSNMVNGSQHSCDGLAELEQLMREMGWKYCPGPPPMLSRKLM